MTILFAYPYRCVCLRVVQFLYMPFESVFMPQDCMQLSGLFFSILRFQNKTMLCIHWSLCGGSALKFKSFMQLFLGNLLFFFKSSLLNQELLLKVRPGLIDYYSGMRLLACCNIHIFFLAIGLPSVFLNEQRMLGKYLCG